MQGFSLFLANNRKIKRKIIDIWEKQAILRIVCLRFVLSRRRRDGFGWTARENGPLRLDAEGEVWRESLMSIPKSVF